MKIAIFGAGDWGNACENFLQQKSEFVDLYLDNDPSKQNTCVNGKNVLSLHAFQAMPNASEFKIIVAIDSSFPVIDQLQAAGITSITAFHYDTNGENSFICPVEELFSSKGYDNEYKCWEERYFVRYDESMYYKRFCMMFDMMRKKCPPPQASILELGAGTGQFAEMLFDNGYNDYRGVDLSPLAIEQAKSIQSGKYADRFTCADFFTLDFEKKTDCIVTMECLEHILKDIELIQRFKPSTHLYFSVPTFMSFSHVRCFDTIGAIEVRYGKYIRIMGYQRLDYSDKQWTHLVESIVR